jgi:integrase
MPRRKGRRSFGSVRQLPSGRWQARYRDAAGKSHTAPETFATRPEAARFLAQVETDLARGEWTDPRAGRVSFAEWAGHWQATTTNLRPNTRALRGDLLRRFLLPAFADTALADLDLMVVRSWLAGLEREVAAYAGLRWGELVGLRIKRVDLLHQRITVAEQATEINGHFTWGPPKTEVGRHTVTLPAVAAAGLAHHLSTYSQPGPEGLVFTSAEGGLLRCSNFQRRVWRPATRAAGVAGLRFH